MVTLVDAKTLAGLIDHTLLKPEATLDQIRNVCVEAKQFHFASVCVNPYWIPLVSAALVGTRTKACSVVGFPLGASTTAMKAAETKGAVDSGAREIDMVLNIGELKAGNLAVVRDDIRAVVDAAHAQGAIVKVIFETCLLTKEEKLAACELSLAAGADFVKTSTGFSTAGAKVSDIRLMRKAVGGRMGIKASGGIRTLADVQKMLAAGATRIGASGGVKIVTSLETTGETAGV
jgi:deoxyribose-phosphate aldolase